MFWVNSFAILSSASECHSVRITFPQCCHCSLFLHIKEGGVDSFSYFCVFVILLWLFLCLFYLFIFQSQTVTEFEHTFEHIARMIEMTFIMFREIFWNHCGKKWWNERETQKKKPKQTTPYFISKYIVYFLPIFWKKRKAIMTNAFVTLSYGVQENLYIKSSEEYHIMIVLPSYCHRFLSNLEAFTF